MSLRRLTLFLSVFFTAAVGPAASAFAHHVDVTATVDCAGTVTATATSWAGDANDPVALDLQRTNTGATLSVDGSTVASGPLTKANGYSITGSRLVAGAPGTVVPVTVEYGAFGNGSAGGSRATSVTLTDGCAPPPPAPANPAATVGDVVCASGGATVSLTNTGGVAATVTVTRDGATTDTVTVAPGATASSLVPIAEDATVTIAATSGNTTLVSRTLKLDCVPAPPAPAAPAATVGDVSCADFGAVVTLTNTGGTPATFTVTRDGTNVATVSVAGGATATQAVPIAENATATITVTAPGMPDVTRTLTRDCLTAPAPAATVGTVDCINGGAFVNLVNTGGETATFTITRDGVAFDTVTVTGSGTGSRLVPITEDTTATISVAAPGMTTVTATVTRDCVPAGPTASNTTPPSITTPTPTTTPIAAPATPTAVDANPTDVEAANLEPRGAEATPSDSNDTAPVAAEAVVTPTSTETSGGTLP
ncbi:MAG: hypothetical protein JWM98_2032, partial [Thermoleophilia bacterium]|nr:hypothetical protein [Thermoleophilia bacterium]